MYKSTSTLPIFQTCTRIHSLSLQKSGKTVNVKSCVKQHQTSSPSRTTRPSPHFPPASPPASFPLAKKNYIYICPPLIHSFIYQIKTYLLPCLNNLSYVLLVTSCLLTTIFAQQYFWAKLIRSNSLRHAQRLTTLKLIFTTIQTPVHLHHLISTRIDPPHHTTSYHLVFFPLPLVFFSCFSHLNMLLHSSHSHFKNIVIALMPVPQAPFLPHSTIRPITLLKEKSTDPFICGLQTLALFPDPPN